MFARSRRAVEEYDDRIPMSWAVVIGLCGALILGALWLLVAPDRAVIDAADFVMELAS